MPAFSKKNVYHSWLANKSPIVLQFTSDPMKSLHNDGYFVWFKVRGDDDPEASYCYTIENTAIMNTVKDLDQSRWYECAFTANQTTSLDMAGEEVVEYEQLLEIVGEVGTAPAPTFKRKDGQTVVAPDVNNLTDLIQCYKECLAAATRIAEGQDEFTKIVSVEVVGDIIQRIANSLFIQWGYRAFSGTLDGDSVDVDARGNEASSVDATEQPVAEKVNDFTSDLRRLVDSLPSKNGKAHDNRAIKTVLNKIEKAVASGDIPLEDYVQMANWLRMEVSFQTPATPEVLDPESDDDLPF